MWHLLKNDKPNKKRKRFHIREANAIKMNQSRKISFTRWVSVQVYLIHVHYFYYLGKVIDTWSVTFVFQTFNQLPLFNSFTHDVISVWWLLPFINSLITQHFSEFNKHSDPYLLDYKRWSNVTVQHLKKFFCTTIKTHYILNNKHSLQIHNYGNWGNLPWHIKKTFTLILAAKMVIITFPEQQKLLDKILKLLSKCWYWNKSLLHNLIFDCNLNE